MLQWPDPHVDLMLVSKNGINGLSYIVSLSLLSPFTFHPSPNTTFLFPYPSSQGLVMVIDRPYLTLCRQADRPKKKHNHIKQGENVGLALQ
jgi:hypothetical protein